jgi:hypothetical protein
MNDYYLTESDIEKLHFLQPYLSISNNDLRVHEKRSALRAVGASEQEIDALCKPTEIDREEVLRAVKEMTKRERRLLAKENRERPKEPPCPIWDSTGHRVKKGEITFLDPEQKDTSQS